MKPTPIFVRHAVAAAIVAEPSTTYDALAIRFAISPWMVKKIAKDAGLSRPRGIGSPSWKQIRAVRQDHKPKAVSVANQEKRGIQSNSYQQGRNTQNPERVECIFQELTSMARMLFRHGYGTTQLIFSDWSFVSRTDSGLMSEVEALLRAGHKPLGFIAPDRDRKRNPFIEAWQRGDNVALGELRSLAHSMFWHLLPERNEQPGNGPEWGK